MKGSWLFFSQSHLFNYHCLKCEMKILENNKSVAENQKLLRDLTDSHLENLMTDQKKNQQKILEVSHVGKFLMFFDNKLQIDQLSETPDFILKSDLGKIGLEHQTVLDNKAKGREGFLENIFSIAESELQSDIELPNFCAECYIIPYTNFKVKEKQKLVTIIKNVVKEYVLTGVLIENPIIDRIWKMPHSGINITGNFGGWWYQDISADVILKAIEKKEKLITEYKKNGGNIQWLLMVIGSTGESSYYMNQIMDLNLKTEFDKVYIMEDFATNLYEIK